MRHAARARGHACSRARPAASRTSKAASAALSVAPTFEAKGAERAYRTALQRPSKLFDGAVEVAPAIRLGADAGTAVVAAVPCCDSVCGEAAGPDACSDGIWEDPCWGGTRDVP